MLPRLIAEESLREAERIGVGSGAYGAKAKPIVRDWRREAGRGERGVAVKPTPAALAAIGIGSAVKVKR